MSVAERTRRAVRSDPALYDALRAGVINYSAAARALDVDGDEESIATALRRFADELPERDGAGGRVSVRLHRGVALDPSCFGGASLEDDGEVTAIEVTGDVDAGGLERTLGSLRSAETTVLSAGVADGRLVVAVERRAGAAALRVVERALDAA